MHQEPLSSHQSQAATTFNTFSHNKRISSKIEIDKAIADLTAHKQLWADVNLQERIRLLSESIKTTITHADEWAEADLKSREVAIDNWDAGVSYINPVIALRVMKLYLKSLKQIHTIGRPQIPGPVITHHDDQVTARVFPTGLLDNILFNGLSGELWFESDVNITEMKQLQAQQFHLKERKGKLALVLGAGNYSSLTVTDLLYKLLNELQVVLIKIHPVTEFMGDIILKSFAPFIEAGFVRIVYGGVSEGEYICTHTDIDEIHMTGSDKTFEAIVFGAGADGEKNKKENKPRFNKRVTGELGNVTPVIIVPGPWQPQEVAYQAENIVSMLIPNNGFTCAAIRVVIQHDNWHLRNSINEKIQQILTTVPAGNAYYPGSEQRIREAADSLPQAALLGQFAEGKTPWVFAENLKATDCPACFAQEVFGGFIAETGLSAHSVSEYIDNAVAFCNEQLWGTLSATLIVHPDSLKDPDVNAAVDRAMKNLKYGTVGVNLFSGFNLLAGTTAWGGFPGATYNNIQSGNCWVNNVLMLEKIQKSVMRGPFRMPIKPFTFPSHRNSLNAAKIMLAFEKKPTLFNLVRYIWNVLKA